MVVEGQGVDKNHSKVLQEPSERKNLFALFVKRFMSSILFL